MKAQPHVHDVVIRDHGSYWHVVYGDQSANPDKPRFRDPVKVLDAAVEKLIRKHDEASVRAGRDQSTIETVLSRFVKRAPQRNNWTDVGGYTLPDPDRWGSEQLR